MLNHTRRISAAMLLITFFASMLDSQARESGDRPNIIIFFLDDGGYGDYAHNGNPTIRTPNITKLTQDGISFSQFYVTSPACSASRYSLLTGRYPARSGLGSWVIGPNAKRHLHTKEVTLAEALKTRGYKTGMFGKWHLGTPNKQNKMTADSLPLAHGFDTWTGSNVSHDYGTAQLITSDPSGNTPISGYRVLADKLRTNLDVSANLTEQSTSDALTFITEHKNSPFFAYIPMNMPHLGIHAGKDFVGKSRRGLLGDVMEEIDASVGRIRQALADHKLTENTLIIFSSDNGPWIRFRNTAQHDNYGEARLHVGYATPFRDGKGSTWEGGHRVPGIFCWPGTIPGNRVIQEPASTLDIYPTLIALAGATLPDDRSIDGRDIRPHFFPGKFQSPIPDFELFYSASDNNPSALRIGPWKMHIRLSSQTGNNYGFTASPEKPLLFQVEHDISERIDRAGEQADIIASMKAKLEAHNQQVREEGTFWDNSPAVK